MRVFGMLDKFWSVEEFEPKAKNIKTLQRTRWACNFSCGFALTTFVLWAAMPIFTKRLPNDGFWSKRVTGGSWQFYLFYGLEVVFSLAGCLPTAWFTTMTVYILVRILCELRILSRAYSSIGLKKGSDEFLNCCEIAVLIEHHSLVLK